MADINSILDALLARLQPRIRDAFRAAIADVTNTTVLADLVKAIEAGDYQRAFQVLGMNDAALRPITAALRAVYEAGGVAVGQTFPKVLRTTYGRGVFRFDVTNPRAEKWLAEQSSALITNIKEDARVNVMNVMQAGLQEGNNPRVTALDIVGRVNPTTQRREGGIIGLNQQQELWVRNAREDLQTGNYGRYLNRIRRDKRFDRIVMNALASGEKLDQDTINKLVSRYKDSLLQLRGETIARTETIQSLNRSQYEALAQARDMGAIGTKDIQREWDTAGDDRVRDTHKEMDGQSVGLDEPFKFPEGGLAMFPGDSSLGAPAGEIINCRCRVKMKIDWLSRID